MGNKPPADAGTESYAMYLFAGMLPWLLFSDTVIRASSSIVEQSNLITKTMFPSEIVPVSIFQLIKHCSSKSWATLAQLMWESKTPRSATTGAKLR